MTPERHPSGLHEDPEVLLPGLEYARSLIETAILICSSFAEERRDPAPDSKAVKREH